MKRLRFLLLLGVTITLAAVLTDYVITRGATESAAISEPDVIPSDLDSQASSWRWSQSSGENSKVEIRARSFRQVKETLQFDLEEVELRIHHQESADFDRITTESARFDPATESLFSETEVRIWLNVGEDLKTNAGGQPTQIKTTGVTFQTRNGIASTEEAAEYTFEGGRGHSTGAFYDSARRYLRMKSDAYIRRYSDQPGAPPLELWSEGLDYYEAQEIVKLHGASRLRRGTQTVNSPEATIRLENGVLRRIEANDASGYDDRPHHRMEFQADKLDVQYSTDQILESVTGTGGAQLVATAEDSAREASGEAIFLIYAAADSGLESELTEATVRGHATVKFRSHPERGANSGLRTISSEAIRLRMKPGGSEVERMETLAPGKLEVLPPSPTGWRRTLQANRIGATYGSSSRLEGLSATGGVELRSYPPEQAQDGVPAPAALTTWSDRLEGAFDPGTGDLVELRQWESFRFTKGFRKGSSESARFDIAAGLTELQGNARVSEPAGVLSASLITLDEASGDISASGKVSGSHQGGDDAADDDGGLFSQHEAIFATGHRMRSSQETGEITYLGEARMWQGDHRVEADRISVYRQEKKLSALGRVVSWLRETDGEPEDSSGPAKDAGADRGSAELMRIRSRSLDYDDITKVARYQGQVQLRRPGLLLHCDRLIAQLEAEESRETTGGRLQKADAFGHVEILERVQLGEAARRGWGDQAEYDAADEKVILVGQPALIEKGPGDKTSGERLTYFLDDDRLLVLSGKERSYSYRRRRP